MKYSVTQTGGQADSYLNDYVDSVIANNQSYIEPQYSTQPEEDESDYIKGLREYDEEQNKFNPEEYFKSKLSSISDMFDQKLEEMEMQKQQYDWFATEDGNDFIANQYDTRNTSNQQAGWPFPFRMNAAQPAPQPSSSRNNYGNIRSTDGQFRSFSTPEEGKAALVNQLTLYQTGRTKVGLTPTSTLYEAMNKYAPKGDGSNNPKAYAEFIAKRLGITADAQIQHIDTVKWAEAIAAMEGNKNIGK